MKPSFCFHKHTFSSVRFHLTSVVYFLSGLVCILVFFHSDAQAGPAHSDDDVVIDTQRIVETSELVLLASSPDEKYLSSLQLNHNVADNKIYAQWVILEADSLEVVKTLPIGPFPLRSMYPMFHPAYWGRDSDALFFLRRSINRSGASTQIWKFDLRDDQFFQLTQSSTDVIVFSYDKSADKIVYFADPTDTEKELEALYRNGINVADMVPDDDMSGLLHFPEPPVLLSGEINQRNPLARFASGYDFESIFVLDVDSGNIHPSMEEDRAQLKAISDAFVLSNLSRRDSSENGVISDSGDTAFLTPTNHLGITYMGEKVPAIFQLSVRDKAGKIKICRHPVCEAYKGVIRGVSWAPDQTSILFRSSAGRAHASETVYEWNTDTDALKIIWETDGVLDAYSLDGRCPLVRSHIACVQTGPLDPPFIVKRDIEAGNIIATYDPNGKLRRSVRSRFKNSVRTIQWTGALGEDRKAWLVLPPEWDGTQRLPLVITSYTCTGFLRGGTGKTVPEFVVAENGMAALCIQSDSRSGVFDESQFVDENGKLEPLKIYKNEAISWEILLEELSDEGIFNLESVGASGLSFSAATLTYALTHMDFIAVGASGPSGDHDPYWIYSVAASENTFVLRLYEERRGLPWPSRDPDRVWERFSAALNAEQISAPILYQAADSEFRSMTMLVGEMKQTNPIVDMYVFPNEGHQFLQPAHKFALAERNIDWFRFWLQGYEDSDEVKADQYDRWREIKHERCTRDEPADKKPTYCQYSTVQ